MSDEVYLWQTDKHLSFLQVDDIILGMHSQVCLKYPKLLVHNIFAISQGKHENEVDFLPADKRQRFLQIYTIILGVCGQGCPNYPK